jgi:hypothetical protein
MGLNRAALPSWESILTRIGERPPRRRRARCPIHGGDSPFSLALDEDKGLFHCHVCHAGGDKLAFIRQYLKCDFAGALQWFGLAPGRPPAPDPEMMRRQKAREGLRQWAATAGRRMRREFRTRELVITRAIERLERDPEDERGWSWLAWALKGHAELEYALDMVDIGTDESRLVYWRQAGRAA